jgi:hypothetical protein
MQLAEATAATVGQVDRESICQRLSELHMAVG